MALARGFFVVTRNKGRANIYIYKGTHLTTIPMGRSVKKTTIDLDLALFRRLKQYALDTDRTIREIVRDKGILTEGEMEEILDPGKMV